MVIPAEARKDPHRLACSYHSSGYLWQPTTDLPASELEGQESVLFRLLGQELRGLVDSYGHEQPGALVALVDSENFIEIAAVNGSAAKVLGAKIGDIVDVIFNR